jgi:hypothetical protein
VALELEEGQHALGGIDSGGVGWRCSIRAGCGETYQRVQRSGRQSSHDAMAGTEDRAVASTVICARLTNSRDIAGQILPVRRRSCVCRRMPTSHRAAGGGGGGGGGEGGEEEEEEEEEEEGEARSRAAEGEWTMISEVFFSSDSQRIGFMAPKDHKNITIFSSILIYIPLIFCRSCCIIRQ